MKILKHKNKESDFWVTKKNKVKAMSYNDTVGSIKVDVAKLAITLFVPKVIKETKSCYGFDSTDLRAIADYMDSLKLDE